jgi:CRISPR-associated protein Cas2
VKFTLTVNCQYSTVSCLFGDLVIYDLPDSEGANKRRTRLHKLLSGYRKWTQYSVFECFLTAVQFVKLQQQVEQLIKPVEDSVRIYVLDAGWVKRTITYGSKQPREERAIVF